MIRFLKRTVRKITGGKETEKEFLLPQEKFVALQRAIGYRIHNRTLFEQALLHRSYIQYIDNDRHSSNERLEFLGDSILGMVVGEHLYKHFSLNEGELTKLRSRLVNRKALVEYAKQLQLDKYLLISPSAQQSLDRGSDSLMADAYEALIAAVYLDGGYEAVKKFIHTFIISNPLGEERLKTDENFKSMLLEYTQANNLGLPRYIVVNEQGPDHDRLFTIHVFIKSNPSPVGEGAGKSKREAEQAAAYKALQSFGVVPAIPVPH
ncbi:MAG TPA: ribonuclease III [Candidatus Kapabacteria bacterium]|nr:ribonuclease III [Candidatus Kapabacteria bacterium]